MDNSSVVLEGWLTKSPPEKHLWKKKWRERYFILRQGDIPGQYFLEYYSDATHKKLKGRIDLDECEQVDAGLTLKYESGGKSFKHVFDIKLRQRDCSPDSFEKVYYLATKTEEDMNKWVECICTVCGLRMRDEGAISNRYSPEPTNNSNFGHVTNNPQGWPNTRPGVVRTPPTSIHTNNNNSISTTSNATTSTSTSLLPSLYVVPRPSKSPERNGAPTSQESPYVLLRECSTGTFNSHPPSTKKGQNLHTNSKQQHIEVVSNTIVAKAKKSLNVIGPSELYCDFPPPNLLYSKPRNTDANPSLKPSSSEAPHVNWSTFPRRDEETRESVPDTKEGRGHRSRCDSGPQRDLSSYYKTVTNFAVKRSITPNGNDTYHNLTAGTNEAPSSSTSVPPRPPKPHPLGKSKSKSESSTLQDNQEAAVQALTDTVYDIPKTAVESQSFKKEPTALDVEVLPKPIMSSSADENYTFPKPQQTTDVLNAVVPLSKDIKIQSAKHSYTNSAPGIAPEMQFNFDNYDYRPSLPTTSDNQINFLSKGADSVGLPLPTSAQPERSPRTPNSAVSENTPPAVNRDLKPRKKGSESDATNSPSTPKPFHLQPAPVTKRGFSSVTALPASQTLPHNKSNSTSRLGDARHVGAIPDLVPFHSKGSHVIHSRDASTSEDDTQTGKARDELKKIRPAHRNARHQIPEELNYLDLDLDSDNSSPRTPKEGNGKVAPSHNNPVKDGEGVTAHHSSHKTSTVLTLPKDTVYKTVDWNKTDALNKISR